MSEEQGPLDGRSAADQELMTRLEGVYALSPAGAVDAAAMAIASQLERLGADTGFVAAVSEDGLTVEVARVTPASDAPVRLAFPLSSPYPLASAIRRDETLFIASNEGLTCDHPGLARLRTDDHACATLPLHSAQGEVIGAVNVSFNEPRVFTDVDRQEIAALVASCEAELSGF